MRFQVPQFTEIEDKIFGPFTFKQFVYLIGGAGGIFVLYSLLPLYLAIFFGIPVALFSLALAFYKVNNQPFVKIAENAFRYLLSAKLYLWKKKEFKAVPTKQKVSEETEAEKLRAYAPKLTKNKLEDLAWSLDIKEKINR
ncbi:MAG: PrgI family protein [Candidatus Tagabacteria bacterium]